MNNKKFKLIAYYQFNWIIYFID